MRYKQTLDYTGGTTVTFVPVVPSVVDITLPIGLFHNQPVLSFNHTKLKLGIDYELRQQSRFLKATLDLDAYNSIHLLKPLTGNIEIITLPIGGGYQDIPAYIGGGLPSLWLEDDLSPSASLRFLTPSTTGLNTQLTLNDISNTIIDISSVMNKPRLYSRVELFTT